MLSGAALAADAEGIWLSGDGGTKVHISNCGGKLCGKVVWLKEPIDSKTGKPKTDALKSGSRQAVASDARIAGRAGPVAERPEQVR